MAKDKYYFDHDYHARNDDKILELRASFGAEGYGIFWMLAETMAENDNGGVAATLVGGLAHGFGVAKGRLQEIVEECIKINLFYEKDGYYFSRRMLEHKNWRKSLSTAGKRGAEARERNKPPLSHPSTIKGKYKNSSIVKNEEFLEDKEGMGEKETFNHFPKPESFNGLPEINTNQAIQFVDITKKVILTRKDVEGLWGVFKTKNLTGKKFYQAESDVYSHFLDSLKYVTFEPKKQKEQSQAPTLKTLR